MMMTTDFDVNQNDLILNNVSEIDFDNNLNNVSHLQSRTHSCSILGSVAFIFFPFHLKLEFWFFLWIFELNILIPQSPHYF